MNGRLGKPEEPYYTIVVETYRISEFGLSRRKQGFETPTGRHIFGPSSLLPQLFPNRATNAASTLLV